MPISTPWATHPPNKCLLRAYGVFPGEVGWGRNEGPVILFSRSSESSKEADTETKKLQYNMVRWSVRETGNPRLSWKRGCKVVQGEEVAFESLLKGRTGSERACQATRQVGVKAGGHKGIGTFGKFK